MSLHALTTVWTRSRHSGNALLLLLALADWADESGACWGTLATLAAKTRVSEKTIKRLLAELKISGELIIEPKAGHLIPAARGRAAYKTDKYVIREVRTKCPNFQGTPEIQGGRSGQARAEVRTNADAIRVEPNLNQTEPGAENQPNLFSNWEWIQECIELHGGRGGMPPCVTGFAHYRRMQLEFGDDYLQRRKAASNL